jgi:adenosylmethionine-8-amino-7-oxononanoate aminotransferase
MNNKDLIQEDLKYIWHPCTQMKDHYNGYPMIPIKSAKGVYLTDYEDNSYIDAVSSWWVNILGHSNPKINKALKEQVEIIEHTLLAGFTHKPAVDIAKKIVDITPEGLDKVFFADNGSSGIEVALKMSFHYHKNCGKIKPYFVSLTNSYHGETMGALAVGDVQLYKDTYEEILIKTIQTPTPKDMTKESADEAIKEAKKLFEKSSNEISAIIIEPLVQCAGYMRMYHPSFITNLRKLCDEYDIHLIADEVATGFGRTGKMFAMEYSGVSPDFMVLSKGLTGGYLPLALVVTKDEIYDKFYCDYSEFKAFLHSHSYTGNPLACSCANATIDILLDENIIEKNIEKIEYIKEKTKKFESLPNVKEVRQTGMICAIELQGYSPDRRIGLDVYKYGLTKGVILRPLGHVVYFMPPYIITIDEINKMIDTAYSAINGLKD